MSHTKPTVNERLATALKIADENNRRLAVRIAKLEAAVTAICGATGIELEFENPEIEEAAKALMNDPAKPAPFEASWGQDENGKGWVSPELAAELEKTPQRGFVATSEEYEGVSPEIAAADIMNRFESIRDSLDALAQGAAQVEA